MPLSAVLFFLSLHAFGCRTPLDSSEPDEIDPLSGPCGPRPVTSVLLGAEGLGWVGCAGGGVHRTLDAGASFEPMHASDRLEVRQLVFDEQGLLLACGQDLASPGPDTLLLRYSAEAGWERLLSNGDRGLQGPCGRVAVDGAGALVVSSAGEPGLALRAPDDTTWQRPSGWWQGEIGESPILYDLVQARGALYGVGADLISPPVFVAPAWRTRLLPLVGTTVDPDLDGELWALATPDDGETWLVAGRAWPADDWSRGVLYRSADGGSDWRSMALPPSAGWVRDLAYSPDGRCGVAVGHRRGDQGGFVLVRSGKSFDWREVDVILPPLRTVAVVDGGFVVGGSQGFLGRGWCE